MTKRNIDDKVDIFNLKNLFDKITQGIAKTMHEAL